MATKDRIIYLMQYLQENSDENRSVTTAQIREEMARRGCQIIISTLRDDIESLQNAGHDIQVTETEGMTTTYSWLDREWSLPELQILGRKRLMICWAVNGALRRTAFTCLKGGSISGETPSFRWAPPIS